MTMQCDTCNSNGRARPALARLLRRGAVSVAIVAALIAIVLGESWVIERGPALFTAAAPRQRAEHGRGPAAAPVGDVLPIAILH